MDLIKEYMGQYGLSRCLKILGVAKSTYYYQLNRQSPMSKYDHLKKTVEKIIISNPAYGYRRIKAELFSLGIIINHKPLRKLLKSWKLCINRKTKKRAKSGIQTILSELADRVSLVNAAKSQPFRVVFSDITEVRYESGKVYLAASLEAVSKRLIGFSISSSPNSTLVIDSYRKASMYLKNIGVDLESVIFHQDQGSVYTGYEYVGELMRYGAQISYSRIATPSDNPEVESFFGRLKDEWADVFRNAKTEKEVTELIKKALNYYNSKRRHSSIKYLAPDEFIRQELLRVTV